MNYLVSLLVELVPKPLQAGLRDYCVECGAPVWVSLSSLLILADHPDTKTICVICWCLQPGKANVQPLTAAQKIEIQEARRG